MLCSYAEIMSASGRNYSIENHKKPEHADCGQSGNSSCPSLDWCPFVSGTRGSRLPSTVLARNATLTSCLLLHAAELVQELTRH